MPFQPLGILERKCLRKGFVQSFGKSNALCMFFGCHLFTTVTWHIQISMVICLEMSHLDNKCFVAQMFLPVRCTLLPMNGYREYWPQKEDREYSDTNRIFKVNSARICSNKHHLLPQPVFLTHILKLLTLSQTFKRSEKIRSKVIRCSFQGLNHTGLISTDRGILRPVIDQDSSKKSFLCMSYICTSHIEQNWTVCVSAGNLQLQAFSSNIAYVGISTDLEAHRSFHGSS